MALKFSNVGKSILEPSDTIHAGIYCGNTVSTVLELDPFYLIKTYRTQELLVSQAVLSMAVTACIEQFTDEYNKASSAHLEDVPY